MRVPMTMRMLENQLPFPWPIGSTVTTSKWRGLPAILLSSILLQPTSCHFQKPIYLNLKLIRYALFLNPFKNPLSLFLGPEFVFFPNTLCFITIIVSVDIIHVEYSEGVVHPDYKQCWLKWQCKWICFVYSMCNM